MIKEARKFRTLISAVYNLLFSNDKPELLCSHNALECPNNYTTNMWL